MMNSKKGAIVSLILVMIVTAIMLGAVYPAISEKFPALKEMLDRLFGFEGGDYIKSFEVKKLGGNHVEVLWELSKSVDDLHSDCCTLEWEEDATNDNPNPESEIILETRKLREGLGNPQTKDWPVSTWHDGTITLTIKDGENTESRHEHVSFRGDMDEESFYDFVELNEEHIQKKLLSPSSSSSTVEFPNYHLAKDLVIVGFNKKINKGVVKYSCHKSEDETLAELIQPPEECENKNCICLCQNLEFTQICQQDRLCFSYSEEGNIINKIYGDEQYELGSDPDPEYLIFNKGKVIDENNKYYLAIFGLSGCAPYPYAFWNDFPRRLRISRSGFVSSSEITITPVEETSCCIDKNDVCHYDKTKQECDDLKGDWKNYDCYDDMYHSVTSCTDKLIKVEKSSATSIRIILDFSEAEDRENHELYLGPKTGEGTTGTVSELGDPVSVSGKVYTYEVSLNNMHMEYWVRLEVRDKEGKIHKIFKSLTPSALPEPVSYEGCCIYKNIGSVLMCTPKETGQECNTRPNTPEVCLFDGSTPEECEGKTIKDCSQLIECVFSPSPSIKQVYKPEYPFHNVVKIVWALRQPWAGDSESADINPPQDTSKITISYSPIVLGGPISAPKIVPENQPNPSEKEYILPLPQSWDYYIYVTATDKESNEATKRLEFRREGCCTYYDNLMKLGGTLVNCRESSEDLCTNIDARTTGTEQDLFVTFIEFNDEIKSCNDVMDDGGATCPALGSDILKTLDVKHIIKNKIIKVTWQFQNSVIKHIDGLTISYISKEDYLKDEEATLVKQYLKNQLGSDEKYIEFELPTLSDAYYVFFTVKDIFGNEKTEEIDLHRIGCCKLKIGDEYNCQEKIESEECIENSDTITYPGGKDGEINSCYDIQECLFKVLEAQEISDNVVSIKWQFQPSFFEQNLDKEYRATVQYSYDSYKHEEPITDTLSISIENNVREHSIILDQPKNNEIRLIVTDRGGNKILRTLEY
ncbi:hypothetical protein KY320_03670 [Candidatus Woesearchaeota archaeon]|nr:hypothetical protein [Candidatus Woesearchaeota archaeon]